VADACGKCGLGKVANIDLQEQIKDIIIIGTKSRHLKLKNQLV
jgi:hypothetical protein